jgi:hypothetical protein
MTYKICQVVFSTNRLEYLIPTLKSQSNLNFYGCEVHKIFIDDYPKTRNDLLISALVNLYGYDELILHKENLGLSATWTEFWNLVKDRDYDYIFHMEDDVEILEPVLVTDLIELLEQDNEISQVQLARQAWYFTDIDPESLETDIVYKNFRYEKGHRIFSPMASLYPLSITKIPYKNYYEHNHNEGAVAGILANYYGKTSAKVKNFYGRKIINHIGDWFVGKRVLPNEPGYEQFSHYDPDVKYNSKDGSKY